MKSYFSLAIFMLFFFTNAFGQSAKIAGTALNSIAEPIEFANIALFNTKDTSLVKFELSDETGKFQFQQLKAGNYFIKITALGSEDFKSQSVKINENDTFQFEAFKLSNSAISLKETTVTAKRSILEVKPDRTVFNVEGTINSIGSDALNLLRKAPGVSVDNNDNINVLGRSGVLVYVDGKRLPLSGTELSIYLQNLNAGQIDRIELITNPGSKYEAQGNAGIIDIKLKKDASIGANGNINMGSSQGRYNRSTIQFAGNVRSKILNLYGSVGGIYAIGDNVLKFNSTQNGLYMKEVNLDKYTRENANFRLGTDWFLNSKNTIGVLVSGNNYGSDKNGNNRIDLHQQNTPFLIDSSLIANSSSVNKKTNLTYNLNYQYKPSTNGQSLNMDVDYGSFSSKNNLDQTNRFFTSDGTTQLSELLTSFDTPTDIDILGVKADYTIDFMGGKLGSGAKYSDITSDNFFLAYDGLGESKILNKKKSNQFVYKEQVLAGYLDFNKKIFTKWAFSAGLRVENTHSKGSLNAYLPELQQNPTQRDYLSWFPNAGLSWDISKMSNLNLNYGRRINRPDYNVLNPFVNQLSQLSFSKGNPLLKPEIVNNLELGLTLFHMYNIKIAYSKTSDQITRLIGPDADDPRASYINWDNLANQTVWDISASLPIDINKFWNAYFNLSGSHINNQADYGGGAVVDLQAFSYTIFQQHSFKLPWKLTAEISGYYSGPGIWGGVFVYKSSGNLDVGLQKKFLNDKLNVKLSGSDLFYTSGWRGGSIFNGLNSTGSGNWDSRRASINLSYSIGNQKVKSRKRTTGMENEAGRIKGE